MANDCLYKKLKGNVSADLPILDAIRLVVNWDSLESFPIKPSGGNWFIGGPGISLKVDNGSIKVGGTNVGSEYTSTGQEQDTIDVIPTSSTSTTQIVLKGLSMITRLGRSDSFPYNNVRTDDMEFIEYSGINYSIISLFAGVDGEQDLAALEYFPNKSVVSTINFCSLRNAYKGDISIFSQFPSVTVVGGTLARYNPLVYGNVSVFNGNTTITNVILRDNDGIVGLIDSFAGCSELKVLDIQTTKVGGNIASMGSCTKLTRLIVLGNSITGTIEELVAAFVDAGKSTGSITIDITHTGVTFEGNFVSGTKTLAWNGISNITIS